MSGTPVLQTVLKTLRVLEAFARQNASSATLSSLAGELGWGRAATHQYLSTLVRAGWLQQNADRHYQLASRAALFGRFAVAHAGIPPAIPPVMAELVRTINEPISFAVLQGSAAVIVERHEPQRMFAIHRDAERNLPLENTASGQVLRAFDPHAAPERDTALAERLTAVRLHGFAETRAQWMGDIVEAVAVPIMSDGECLGALSAVAPEGRMDILAARAALLEARTRIEAQLTSTEHLLPG